MLSCIVGWICSLLDFYVLHTTRISLHDLNLTFLCKQFFCHIAIQPEDWMCSYNPWKHLYLSVSSHFAHSLKQFVSLRLTCPLYGFQLLLLAFRYRYSLRNVMMPKTAQTPKIQIIFSWSIFVACLE